MAATSATKSEFDSWSLCCNIHEYVYLKKTNLFDSTSTLFSHLPCTPFYWELNTTIKLSPYFTVKPNLYYLLSLFQHRLFCDSGILFIFETGSL